MSSAYAQKFRRPSRPVIFGAPAPERKAALTAAVRRDVARALRLGLTGLPDAESQFLCDWVDGDAYKMVGLDRLVALHVRAATMAAAYALPDRLTLFIAEQRADDALSFEEASYLETIAQAAADPLQHEALSTGCLSKKLLLAEALIAQIRTSKDLLGATLRDVKEGQ